MKTPTTNQTQYREFLSAYSPKLKTTLDCSDRPSRTKQSFKDECDINVIMSRYQKTGVIDFVNTMQPQYGDVTGQTFESAMETVLQAQEMFNALPSSIRNRFQNSPAEFLDFVADEANKPEMARMGLLRGDYSSPGTPLSTAPQKAAGAPSEASGA